MRIYRDILRSAWQTLWRTPWLWPLGLLAALAGNGGEYGSLVSSLERIANQGSFLEALRLSLVSNESSGYWANLWATFAQPPLATSSPLLVLHAATLAVIWVDTVAQASVIHAAGKVDRDEPTDFPQATRAGARYFWPIFWLNVLARFATYLVLAVSILPFLISYLAQPNTGVAFNWLIIISFVIFIPVALVISFILKYASTSVVLEGEQWWRALERAISIFFRNWLVSLEMAALLFGINLLLGFAVFTVIPQTISLDIALLAARGSLTALLHILPSVAALLIVGAGYGAYQYIAWTILYRRLTQGTVVPKLVRATAEVPAYLEKLMRGSGKRVAGR